MTIYMVWSEGLMVSELFAKKWVFPWPALTPEISVSSYFCKFSHRRPCEKRDAMLKRHVQSSVGISAPMLQSHCCGTEQHLREWSPADMFSGIVQKPIFETWLLWFMGISVLPLLCMSESYKSFIVISM